MCNHVHVGGCVCVRACACVRARACVCVCARARVCLYLWTLPEIIEEYFLFFLHVTWRLHFQMIPRGLYWPQLSLTWITHLRDVKYISTLYISNIILVITDCYHKALDRKCKANNMLLTNQKCVYKTRNIDHKHIWCEHLLVYRPTRQRMILHGWKRKFAFVHNVIGPHIHLNKRNVSSWAWHFWTNYARINEDFLFVLLAIIENVLSSPSRGDETPLAILTNTTLTVYRLIMIPKFASNYNPQSAHRIV